MLATQLNLGESPKTSSLFKRDSAATNVNIEKPSGKECPVRDYLKFYIDGQWVDPIELKTLDVDNPTTEQVSGKIALGSAADVDKAVAAARKAFATWSQSTREERLDVLQAIAAEYGKRSSDLADAIHEEMGAPPSLAAGPQVMMGMGQLQTAIDVLKNFSFEEAHGSTLIVKEPIGVCGLITPWNWPVNQIACKVFPALATGCTMVLKPSEVAPYSGQVFTEILDAAGVPAGVYNMVFGDGLGVGVALSSHPDIDLVSFTGSTRAGVDIAKNAAATVKRVTQELGGKSPNIVLDDDKFAESVGAGAAVMMVNTGQSCNAPSRMIVPRARMKEAAEVAAAVAGGTKVGDLSDKRAIGPVASKAQFDKVQGLLQKGVDEGATVAAGGPGRPDGLDSGYYVKPTIFSDVTNDMTIAREEIFGPVLCILAYDDIDDAVEIANDTDYGLAGYVSGADLDEARALARRIRAGQVAINHAFDLNTPFGGYKRSGNGREWSEFGFNEYLEIKSALGYAPEGVTS
jgi:aldehyde dehydrogenase (NAD+)